eukprot:14045876-Alexandrium_andersonii.AAC.1
MQSAISACPTNTVIRLNPQAALPTLQHCFKRSELALRRPEGGASEWAPKPPKGAFHATVRTDSGCAREC